MYKKRLKRTKEIEDVLKKLKGRVGLFIVSKFVRLSSVCL